MMIDESTIYWLTRIDEMKRLLSNFGGGFTVLGIIITFAATIAYFVSVDERSDDKVIKRCKNWALLGIPIILFGFSLNIGNAFVPTTKEYAMIKVIPAIVNNERVQVELNDWYTLAKDGFKDLVTKKTKEVEKK